MRRWWLVGVVLMACGAIATTAVCWWIADDFRLVARWSITLDEDGEWLFQQPSEWPATPIASGWKHSTVTTMGNAIGSALIQGEEVSVLQAEVQYGWPLRAMTVREQVKDPYGNATQVEMTWMDVGVDAYGEHSGRSPMPLKPLWLGFVINSVLAASMFAVVLWTFGPIRKRFVQDVRIHRGLCGGCGYEIGDLVVCPECGAGRP